MAKNDHELLSLFDAVLGQRAHEDDIRRLNSLLEQDEQALELFVSYSQQEVDLRHVLKTDCKHAGSTGAEQLQSTVLVEQSREKLSKSTRLLVALLSCASALVLSAGIIHFATTSALVAPPEAARPPRGTRGPVSLVTKPPAPVAVLAAERDAVWQGPKIFLGQSLREGDAVTLVKGDARISMGFGAEIAAKGPCALRIVSRDRVQLQFGEVAVHVAEWAHGFTVETPAMDVVDLGTTFVVSASRDASAETSVLKGQVRVSPRKKIDGSPRSVLVSEGEALMVESTGRRLSVPSLPCDNMSCVDFGVEQPYRSVGLHNSGYGFNVGDEDPHWRVIKGPEGVFSGPQFAMVCEPDARYLANYPSSSQWVSMAGWRTAAPNSLYTFETKFDLTGFDLKTVQLFGRILADNGIKEVRVNGSPVILESWVDNVPGQKFSQPQFRTVNVSEGLIEGINTIEIDVWNAIMQPARQFMTTPNPMALRVEWEGFGRPMFVPEAATEKAQEHAEPSEAAKL